ncbi:MAG: hypothetical protein IID46_11515, partial [Planctomycetes bacterium]|nr:hypothetical protein [Planctomycetota bacterium]
MAGQNIRWLGHSRKVAQVDTITLSGTWEANDEVDLTINNKTLIVVGNSTDAQTVAAAVVIAWNNVTTPEFAEITATQDGRAIILTADTAGKPFTLTAKTTEQSASGTADDQVLTHVTKVASAGPSHVNDVDNYSLNRLPVNGDRLFIESGADLLYDLDALSGVSLTKMDISQKWTGKIGLPVENSDGSLNYDEYRPTYFEIGSTTITIGLDEGQGSGRIKINGGSVQTTLNIHNTGTADESGLGAVIWKGTHASNVINITKGSLDVAPFAGEIATISTLRVGFRDNPLGDSTVRLSDGVTLTTINVSGGNVSADSDITTLTQTNGVTTLFSGDITTLALDSGQCFYRGTGTLATVTINANAELNFDQELRGRTITNVVNM